MNASFHGGTGGKNIELNEVQATAENGGDHLNPPLQKLSHKRRHGFSSAFKIAMVNEKNIGNHALVCQAVK